jgi:predicted RNase H-like HicB family nuclease
LQKRGRKLVADYRLLIEADDGAGFIGCAVEMPLVFGEGKTIAACAEDTLEALALAVATMLEKGQRPPSPAREGKREHQVNIRLTADEKLSLEAATTRGGFRSISDFIRAAALDKAS